MKKIGVVTLYYNNNNYGGIAQSFALVDFLNDNGYKAELVSYKRSPQTLLPSSSDKKINQIYDGFWKKVRKKLFEKPMEKCLTGKYQDWINTRIRAFEKSREEMPHSQVYTEETIKETENIYDVFVTGSDQVWKPGVIQGAYVWDFLSNDKKCISYAASITTESYPDWYSQYMKKNLDKYSWISVREKSAQAYLQEIMDRNIDLVVDPTFLVSDEKWNRISTERQIDGKYIFAYLLGDSYAQRSTIKRIAKAWKLPVVTLSHVENKVRVCDLNFGDEQLYDVDLSKFLSLIKYAECVFTDSFHAAVFSNIYETNFWVFDRAVVSKKDKMSSRIETLLCTLGEEERKIKDSQRLSINEIKKDIDFKNAKRKMNEQVQFSKEKLLEAIRL